MLIDRNEHVHLSRRDLREFIQELKPMELKELIDIIIDEQDEGHIEKDPRLKFSVFSEEVNEYIRNTRKSSNKLKKLLSGTISKEDYYGKPK